MISASYAPTCIDVIFIYLLKNIKEFHKASGADPGFEVRRLLYAMGL